MKNINSKIKWKTLCPQLKFETQIYSHLVPNKLFLHYIESKQAFHSGRTFRSTKCLRPLKYWVITYVLIKI
jgi:hypothetical protein